MPEEQKSVENLDVSIGLVQINNSFSGQSYLPYSVACLQSYVMQNARHPGRYDFRVPVFKRMPIREIVASLEGVDIAGFSTYVWNAEISFEAARRLKQRCRDTLIVFGGPQVPDDPEEFLRQHSFVDVVVHNEGEKTFLRILEAFPSNDWSSIPGLSYLSEGGDFVRTLDAVRIRDLKEVPSPFLAGVFEPLMKANAEETWIGLWETNRGCPFSCTFCDWGSATAAKVNKFEEERLFREAEWFADKKIEYVFCCDANFGILKRDIDIARHVAKVKQNTGYPKALSVQNTKNATNRAYEVQKILSDANLNKGVALSLQSVDETTLEHIKRDNISLETYHELQRRFTQDGVETYSDLILALPGETYETFADGVSLLIEAGQHNRIQFNNLSILPNAEMAKPEYIEQHGMSVVRSKIINIHGSLEEMEDDVPEFQDLVVATKTMPKNMWRKTRVFSWMTALLHFNKIYQLPLMAANKLTGISYRTVIEAFVDAESAKYPILSEISALFEEKAQLIQNGGPEYVYSDEWLGIYWPADEYVFIKLTVEGRLEDMVAEAERLLLELVASQPGSDPNWRSVIAEASRLNLALIKQPFQAEPRTVDVGWNLMQFWQNVRVGQPAELLQEQQDIHVLRDKAYYRDLQAWCREVVWWGNKKGAYLYNTEAAERQLAGHF